MASAAELVWQWAYLMAVLLIVLILICCFGGCWGSFSANVRGFCADGVNCGFSPFRKKKKRVGVVTVDGKRTTTMLPEDAVMVRTAGGETVVADGELDGGAWPRFFGRPAQETAGGGLEKAVAADVLGEFRDVSFVNLAGLPGIG